MNWQLLIVDLIIAAALGLTAIRLYRFFSPPATKCHGCSGCSLKEQIHKSKV
jgi:hypothetical protein